MSEWQTIDSAPKDGRNILLLTSHGAIEGFYKKFVDGSGYFAQTVAFGNGSFGDIKHPTHWMQLPAQP